jgi:hypothetical protein
MLAAILDPAPTPAEQCDRTFWLDHGKRHHRLRRTLSGFVSAVCRDGRNYRLRWPDGESIPPGEAFAARVFAVCERYAKTAAEN